MATDSFPVLVRTAFIPITQTACGFVFHPVNGHRLRTEQSGNVRLLNVLIYCVGYSKGNPAQSCWATGSAGIQPRHSRFT
jgi:hypothetical protein